MTPRQPYRSPFWQPETAPVEAAPRVSQATRAGSPVRHADRPLPEPAAKRLAVPSNIGGYAASDLALFSRLMPTSGQSLSHQASATGPRDVAPRQMNATQPEHGRTVGLTGSQTYNDADHAKFAKLQTGFADVRGGLHRAESHLPSAASPPATHGYSQQDLEAFERLARFGPAG